jgi:nucleoside-diphosphate-sugar epimerase
MRASSESSWSALWASMGEKRHSKWSPPFEGMSAHQEHSSSARTKLAAEKAFRTLHPTATIVRPSLVFGPGDQFFAVSFIPESAAAAAERLSSIPFVEIRKTC